jgi:threonine dehydratase
MEFIDVLRARQTIAPYLPATPLWSYPELDRRTGATVYVKHEHVQPTGAFKVRGGITLLAGLDAGQRGHGIVAYSTGNHAQSLAYAARLFGVECRIAMPAEANPTKVAAIRALGAEVDLYGEVLEDARARAEKLAADRGMRLVGVAEPELIAGVATAYLEILAAQPDLDAILVPVGSGSGAAGACLVAAALAPRCRIIGVQSAQAPAGHDSWRAGKLVDRPNRTVVEGLAAGTAFELPQAILRRHLADFVLVPDGAIRRAQYELLASAHTLAEGAGAAALAAVLAEPARFAGQRIAVMCSGGNASVAEVAEVAGQSPRFNTDA